MHFEEAREGFVCEEEGKMEADDELGLRKRNC